MQKSFSKVIVKYGVLCYFLVILSDVTKFSYE